MVDLSVLISSFNTKDITHDCINALVASLKNSPDRAYEIIIIDNASSDGSIEMLQNLQNEYKEPSIIIKTIFNTENVGFAKANNIALKEASGKYILYLNSDVIINSVNFSELLAYMDSHEDIGALTVKVNLTPEKIDPASHRGFPTIWNSFSYFSGLEKLTSHIPLLNSIFGGYHLTQYGLDTMHKIDSPSGAFYLSKKDLLDKLQGFDEQFFMYGEDLDLSYRIKQLGYIIVYYPIFSVTHLKSKSGLKTSDVNIQRKIRAHFYDAMKLFYRKHYAKKHPEFINNIVYFFIGLKKNIHDKTRN